MTLFQHAKYLLGAWAGDPVAGAGVAFALLLGGRPILGRLACTLALNPKSRWWRRWSRLL